MIEEVYIVTYTDSENDSVLFCCRSYKRAVELALKDREEMDEAPSEWDAWPKNEPDNGYARIHHASEGAMEIIRMPVTS